MARMQTHKQTLAGSHVASPRLLELSEALRGFHNGRVLHLGLVHLMALIHYKLAHRHTCQAGAAVISVGINKPVTLPLHF